MIGNQQNNKWSFIILAFVLLLAAGCGDIEPTNAVKKTPEHDKKGARNKLRIVFKWPGDDVASRQDLAIRDKIGDLIRERGVGKIIRAGTGMGWMDILIEVENKDNATAKLEAIIKETAPAIIFNIEDVERRSCKIGIYNPNIQICSKGEKNGSNSNC